MVIEAIEAIIAVLSIPAGFWYIVLMDPSIEGFFWTLLFTGGIWVIPAAELGRFIRWEYRAIRSMDSNYHHDQIRYHRALAVR